MNLDLSLNVIIGLQFSTKKSIEKNNPHPFLFMVSLLGSRSQLKSAPECVINNHMDTNFRQTSEKKNKSLLNLPSELEWSHHQVPSRRILCHCGAIVPPIQLHILSDYIFGYLCVFVSVYNWKAEEKFGELVLSFMWVAGIEMGHQVTFTWGSIWLIQCTSIPSISVRTSNNMSLMWFSMFHKNE